MVYGGQLCSLGKAQILRVDALSAIHVQVVGEASIANSVEQYTSRQSASRLVFNKHVGDCFQVAKHTLGQQEEMAMVLKSRGDFTDTEKQRQ